MPSKSNIVAIVIIWLIYSFKKQKKSSIFYPPIPDHHAIKIYIDQPYLEWERLQSLFLPSFMSIQTSQNKSSNQIAWIKDDKYNHWYHAFNTFASSFIIKVAKLLVDAETSAAIAQKNKGLLAEMAAKAQEKLFRPAMTKQLGTYMIFVIDSSDFS